jgi:hypothetical protein
MDDFDSQVLDAVRRLVASGGSISIAEIGKILYPDAPRHRKDAVNETLTRLGFTAEARSDMARVRRILAGYPDPTAMPEVERERPASSQRSTRTAERADPLPEQGPMGPMGGGQTAAVALLLQDAIHSMERSLATRVEDAVRAESQRHTAHIQSLEHRIEALTRALESPRVPPAPGPGIPIPTPQAPPVPGSRVWIEVSGVILLAVAVVGAGVVLWQGLDLMRSLRDDSSLLRSTPLPEGASSLPHTVPREGGVVAAPPPSAPIPQPPPPAPRAPAPSDVHEMEPLPPRPASATAAMGSASDAAQAP